MDSVQVAALRRASEAIRMAMQPAPKGKPKFSLVRTLLGIAEGDLNGFELEMLREFGGNEFDPRRPVVPLALLGRDLAASNSGGYLVATDNLEPASLLRSYSVVARAGVQVVDGLRGNATIPLTTARPAVTWLADEATALTGVAATVGSLAFTPKHAAALTVASGQLLRQSPYAEAYIRKQLLETVGIAADEAVLNGSGNSGQPLGILNSSDIGTQSGTSLAQAGVVHMKKLVADSGAQDDAISFIGSTDTRELLEGREAAAGSGFIWANARVASQPAYATTTMPAASLLCGDFSRVVFAVWGLELLADPFTLFQTGRVQFRVSLLCDVGAVQPGAFAKSVSIT